MIKKKKKDRNSWYRRFSLRNYDYFFGVHSGLPKDKMVLPAIVLRMIAAAV
jgi:hypothetical protein